MQNFTFAVKSDLAGITDRTIIVTAQGVDAAGNRSAVAAMQVVATEGPPSGLTLTSPRQQLDGDDGFRRRERYGARRRRRQGGPPRSA
jgi:hypothetical protein